MNYAALGEYTAMVAQARDAAGRRFAHMSNAAVALRRAADSPAGDDVLPAVRAQLDDAEAADREMRAALASANQAADLCGQRRLSLADLRLHKD